MGEGYGHIGCARWAREMKGLCKMCEGKPKMRELESYACSLVSERAER